MSFANDMTKKMYEEINNTLDENISDALTEAGYDINDVEFLKANGKIYTFADNNISNLVVEGKLICSWLPPVTNCHRHPKDFPVSKDKPYEVRTTIPFYKPGDKNERQD